MSILVYTENWDGKFKKLSYELVAYASKIAEMSGTSVTAISIGNVSDDELNSLCKYGADKILNVSDDKLQNLDNRSYASAITQAAEKEGSKVIVFSHNNVGKALAPIVSVKIKAGIIPAASGLPVSIEPFTISKKTFNGSAFGNMVIKTDIKVITLLQNSYEIIENPKSSNIEAFAPSIDSIKTAVKETNKTTGKILLSDADVVVSAGRGLKSADNWGPIEELATILNGAIACSRPVSDEGWRPHEEHVGQTGKIIAPNLYFAIGISGAIQHMAGVSGSKCVVSINKDPDAPVFETSDYGIVGDALKVLPELVDAVKKLKNS